jgi:hypothetical protein
MPPTAPHRSATSPGDSPTLVCRFVLKRGGIARVGAAHGADRIADLTAGGVESLAALFDAADPPSRSTRCCSFRRWSARRCGPPA